MQPSSNEECDGAPADLSFSVSHLAGSRKDLGPTKVDFGCLRLQKFMPYQKIAKPASFLLCIDLTAPITSACAVRRNSAQWDA